MNYPVIDLAATGQNIKLLREAKGISVGELSRMLGLADVQAVYKWQRGVTLPNIDNLLALSVLFQVPIEKILSYR